MTLGIGSVRPQPLKAWPRGCEGCEGNSTGSQHSSSLCESRITAGSCEAAATAAPTLMMLQDWRSWSFSLVLYLTSMALGGFPG